MTNYEWLKNHDCMPTFIDLLKAGRVTALTERYGLPETYYQYVADWLEEEHIFKKYVALDEVKEILRMPMRIEGGRTNGKTQLREVLNNYYADMMVALNNLQVKVIDE